jgi:hypothetical protein
MRRPSITGGARFLESLPNSPGDIELYILPGRYGYQRHEKGNWVETDKPWAEKIVDVVEGAVGKLLMTVLDLRFGE